MTYKVYVTESFNKILNSFSKFEQEIINKIFFQLKENPYVGDSIRYKFLREKRIKDKRLYYLVYDNYKLVLVVGISDKKTQQRTIDNIVSLLPEFEKYVESLFRD